MTLFDVGAILLALAALFGYLNHRLLRLPATIGLMLIALVSSLMVLLLGELFPRSGLHETVSAFVVGIDFNQALMHGMLSFLLFSGALHVDLGELWQRRWSIGLLATLGLVISTALIGLGAYWVFASLGVAVPLLHCLIFGALISPTDPVSVLGILKTAGASNSLQAKIAGESLFNDGIGVVLFTVLLALGGFGRLQAPGPTEVLVFFAEEALGGILLGLLLGYAAYRALKSIDHFQLEVLITLALVMFGYSLAGWLHASGPLAMVVAGLLIGNHGKRFAMSARTIDHVEKFWLLIDEILNAVLFLLIGLEILVIAQQRAPRFLGLAMVALVLLARLISVAIPLGLLRRARAFSPGAIRILTWGGLRGGISVALALSLPAQASKPLLLYCTYVVVVFSIIVQGLTVRRVVQRYQSGAGRA